MSEFIKSLTRGVALTATALLAAQEARAAAITWQAPKVILGDSDVSTVGTLVSACNLTDGDHDWTFGNSPTNNPTVVNGVSFNGWNGDVHYDSLSGNGNVDSKLTLSKDGYVTSGLSGAFGSASAPFSNLSASYQTLLNSGVYVGAGQASMTFTFSQLTVGTTYLYQGWVNDARGDYYGRTEYLSDGTNNSDTFHFSSSPTAGAPGYYVLGTFTADATSQNIIVKGVNSVPQLNAFQLRAVPEPASLTLLLLGGVALLRRRR